MLTGLQLDQLDPILADLVDGRAVAEGERGRELSYEVSHPLLREVVYQEISGTRKRVLHRQVARSLLDSGRLAEAALHFARSAEPGDDEAVRVLLDAMRQAEQREAFRETLDLLSELVEILPATDPRWLGVLEAMYWQAEWVVDHRAETQAETAIRALRAIDGLLTRSPDEARWATVKFRLANFLAWGTGELEAAEDACREAVRLFEAAGDQRQALLAGRELGWIRGLRGDIAGMAAESAHVVEAADALGDRFVAMQGLAALGYSTILQARFAHGEPAIRRAAAIARDPQVVLPCEHGWTQTITGRCAEPGRTRRTSPRASNAQQLRPAAPISTSALDSAHTGPATSNFRLERPQWALRRLCLGLPLAGSGHCAPASLRPAALQQVGEPCDRN